MEVEEIPSVQSSVIPEPEAQADFAPTSSSNILLVSSLPDNADRECIKEYFESPQSGGCAGAVEGVEFIDPKVVQITLKNHEGT